MSLPLKQDIYDFTTQVSKELTAKVDAGEITVEQK